MQTTLKHYENLEVITRKCQKNGESRFSNMNNFEILWGNGIFSLFLITGTPDFGFRPWYSMKILKSLHENEKKMMKVDFQT
jgi:hypothetical protein